MQNPVEQRHIRSRQDGQVQVGQVAGVGTPRVNHQHFHLRALRLGLLQASEQYRVGVGHIAADDHHAVAVFQVFIAARRRIGAQAALVADHRRRHAQPRIAVDIIGAHQCAGQLVEAVVVLGQQLPGDIERHTVGPVFGNGIGEHVGRVVQGGVPVGAGARQFFAQAQLRVKSTGAQVAGQVQARAFAAQLAEVGRMAGVALHPQDLFAVMLDQHAAAHPAITTGGRGGLAVHQPASRRASITRPFSTRA